jgi:quercetin dioxygenase-like cupin family protein
MQSNQPRRKFLQLSFVGLVTSLLGCVPKLGSANPQVRGVVVQEEEGLHILTGRRKIPMNIQISKTRDGVNSVSFCVEDMTPGRKMRIHKHLYNDELIFIASGKGTLTLDQKQYQVKAGDVAFIPKDTWHGLDNTGSDDLRMVFQYSPAGFEEYFIENGTKAGMPTKDRTEEQYLAAEKKYGMVYKNAEVRI